MAAFARCVESLFVMLFVTPRADVVAYDVVAGQGVARQATGKRGSAVGGTGRGVIWPD